MKFSRFAIAALLFGFVLSGCSKEIRVGKNLQGTWLINSITADGVELMGSVLSSAEFFFGEYDKKDSKGDYVLTTVDVFSGQTSISKGTYSLNSTGEEITFTETGETPSEPYMLSLDGDNLEMEGTEDGVKYIFQAKRK